MAQKVIKIGKSTGITIPKEILREMNLKSGDKVVVSYNKKNASLTVKQEGASPKRQDRIAKLTKDFIERYRDDLEELAKK